MRFPQRRLGTLAEVTLGRQRSPEHEVGAYMTPYLRAANVKDGHLDLSDVKEMNFTPREQVTFDLRRGDVLVTEGAGSLAAVGAAAVWREDLAGTVCFQNTLVRLRPRPGIDARFLAWWARHAYADKRFAAEATGVNIFHLGVARVRSIEAPAPPLNEQRRIADFLDAETTRIDAVISARRRQLALLDEREVAIIEYVLGETDGNLSRLARFAAVRTGLTVDAARAETADDVVRPYLRVANVQHGHLDLATVTSVRVPRLLASRSTLVPGDVLMTEGGDIDKLGRGTVWRGEISGCLHQNHVFAVRPGPAIDPDFVAYLTRTSRARAYFESSGVQSTNLASTSASKVGDFMIPVMSMREQRRVVAQVSDGLGKVRGLRTSFVRQIALLRERRQALITVAVSGQLDIAREIAEEAS